MAWLEEILVRMELGEVTFADARVRLVDERHLTATLTEQPLQTWRTAIKAVTFHNLKIDSGPDGWHTILVFDV